MSTFDGFIKEFPHIQVDYFRPPCPSRPRPLACFLSHVHSDHLVGLEALRSPFVYCSAATRALVLRLETYPCRINFARGILEARKRTYKHLKYILTPAVLELAPGNTVQVTLFDANHCPGSVMFLFEDDRSAALYTGDTRCEPWFVNALVRSPCLVPYAAGLRTLDTVYLDTTHVDKDLTFQTKADGLRDLLQAVARYPSDTVFHLRAWTFGYEDVWAALAATLRTHVHLDSYKLGLYQSLVVDSSSSASSSPRFGTQFQLDPVAPRLVGFMCANAAHEGCLASGESSDSTTASRIHSCESGAGHGGRDCPALQDTSRIVWVRPVVCHLPEGGGDMAEVGAGGGGEDLNRDAVLEVAHGEEAERLFQLIDRITGLSPQAKLDLKGLLTTSLENHVHIPIDVDALYEDYESNDGEAAPALIKKMEDAAHDLAAAVQRREDADKAQSQKDADSPLSRTITFPYARHSSYAEQCDLLAHLRPRDVWPCTVRPDVWFRPGAPAITIRDLFGRFCAGDAFRHDIEMAVQHESFERPHRHEELEIQDSQDTQMSLHTLESLEVDESLDVEDTLNTKLHHTTGPFHGFPYFYHVDPDPDGLSEIDPDSQASAISELSREQRMASTRAVVCNAVGIGSWTALGLASTSDNHTAVDVDLGCG